MSTNTIIAIVILVIIIGSILFITRGDKFELPSGETTLLEETTDMEENVSDVGITEEEDMKIGLAKASDVAIGAFSTREIFVTDGVKHSIPLNEILSGGPAKDGIPSIDNPKFVDTKEADTYLSDEDPGLGLSYKGENRFYPYSVLVWHELVNDTVAGDPLLVSYCPLCLTGIIFDRNIDGVPTEFGVSGRLWKSNLLMYNRAGNEDDESLWSQVLGEAVLGIDTGKKLVIVRSGAVRYGEWKKEHKDTKILSKDTGFSRNYGRDPYGDYYTNRDVSFGATFSDDRLHPKAYVLGIEKNGQFKAYDFETLPVGETVDTFKGERVVLEKNNIGEVQIFIGENNEPLSYIGGFWFSWLAVHPDTELFN